MTALLSSLTQKMAHRGVPITRDPKWPMFRIDRDDRFSNDEGPYK
jgi:uncharacterized protein (DUF2461 family)